MEGGVLIPHHLESTPLKIKTDSAAGSEESVHVFLYTAGRVEAGEVYFKFSSSPVYYIGDCTSYTYFPATLPSDINKVWVITKLPGPKITLECNGVKVVDITMSDDTCSISDWSTVWRRQVEQIKVTGSASDEYWGILPGN